MPCEEQVEAGRVELHQLAVEHATIGADADLHRTQIDRMRFGDERDRLHVAGVSHLRDLASRPFVEGIRLLIGVDVFVADAEVCTTEYCADDCNHKHECHELEDTATDAIEGKG